jgi:omega-hydroxy-beta-dihydromenaquinone-9 sulfotransferase
MERRLRLSLSTWRRLAGRIDGHRRRLDWHTGFLYWLGGACHSLLIRIQDASHAEELKVALPPPPVFLLGFWRSGTTFLHELFCCDPQFGFPSTYACLNPSHFLLTEPWIRKRKAQEQSRRPMDNMSYSWASPQEDEFALLALGAPSPYEALIVPSLMRDPRWLLDLRRRTVEERHRWEEALQHFLRLLALQQGKTMVLKSPPHGFRLPVLPLLFHHARYVIIDRNPYEVFASNLKLWRTLLDLYSLESTACEEVESFVLTAYLVHEEAITEGVRHIVPGSLARVRYEDLVADPVGQMARLYRELGIEDFDAVRPLLEQYLARVANHQRNRFLVSAAQKARIDALWGGVISEKGYKWPEDQVGLI